MGIKYKGKIYDESNIDKLPKNVRHSLRFKYPKENEVIQEKKPEKQEDETKKKPVK